MSTPHPGPGPLWPPPNPVPSGEHRPTVEWYATHCLVQVSDSLDMESAPSLHEVLTDLVEAGRVRIILDMRALDFCDSSGLRALIAGHKRASARAGQVRLADPPTQLRRLLRTTGLDSVLPCDSSVAESAARLNTVGSFHPHKPTPQ